MITNEQISKRAREIWEREGRPEGHDREHWFQAEAELQQRSDNQEAGAAMAAQSSSLLTGNMNSAKPDGARKRTARRSK